ncbi:MAG: hypothetical protein Q9167_004865 [Letrouitia subvulpina]
MTKSERVQFAQDTLYYISPVIVLLYYSASTLASICALHVPTKSKRRTGRNITDGVTFLILMTYVYDSVALLVDNFSTHPQVASVASNVHSISSVLLWFILFASLAKARNVIWYPFYGSWLLTIIFETALLGLSISRRSTSNRYTEALIASQSLRLAALLFILLSSWSPIHKVKHSKSDEESASLLRHDTLQPSAENVGSTLANGYGSMVMGSEADSTAEEDSSDAEDTARKEQKERSKILRKRLKEDGNWLNYIRGFFIFVPYVWPSREPMLYLNIAGVVLCLLCTRVLRVLGPRQVGLVVNALVVGGYMPYREIAVYAVLTMVMSQGGISSISQLLWLPLERYSYKTLTTASYNHVMNLSCDFHDNKQSGELYKSIEQGTSINELLELILLHIGPMLIDLIVAFGYLHYLFGPYMTLLAAVTSVSLIWAILFLNNKQSYPRYRYMETARKESQYMYDSVGGWSTVSYFNRIPYEQDRYKTAVNQHMRAWMVYSLLHTLSWAVQSWVVDLGLYVALLIAGYQIAHGTQKVGMFATLLLYWAQFTEPLSFFTYSHRLILRHLIDAEQLRELFQTKPKVKDGLAKFMPKDGSVKFENVSFSYDGKKPVIRNFSFAARGGQKIALVGETGGGKSTLLKLLFRFYDAQEGSVSIDGQDVRTVNLESLRSTIGVVPQDPSLFNDTVMSNVRYARLGASDEEVMSACKGASIHEKILSFTDGYSSKVGEKGVKLSGGELQRVAIARTILKDPRMILLDEATSSVDTNTESKIQDALAKLMKGRTTFIVAHRLSTVVDADLILVIKDGVITEQGTPKDLLAAKGKYFDLWSKQVGIIPTAQDTTSTPQSGLSNQSHIDDQAKPGSNERQKTWRPDAPEFVPQRLRNTKSTETERFSQSDLVAEPISTSQKTRREGSRALDTTIGSNERPTSSQIAKCPKDKESTLVSKQARRTQRRNQSKSEPSGTSTNREDDLDTGLSMGIRKKPSFQGQRRVSAPDGTPTAADDRTMGQGRRRRRRQKHWRLKNREVSTTQSEGLSSEHSSTLAAESGSQTPVAPATTPATTDQVPVKPDGQHKGPVRFVPGA